MRAAYASRICVANREAGLSLIELMIAMVVGLILLAGVIAIFVSGKRGYGTNSAIAQVQENGRFALDFIRNDTRMTSYMGCTTTARTNNILNPVGQLYGFLLPVYGFEYSNTDPSTATSAAPYVITSETPVAASMGGGNWTPVADATLPVNAIPGSDALLLYTAVGNPVYVTAPTAGGVIPVSDSTGFVPDQLAVITDCLRSTVFQMSATTNTTPGTLTVGSGGAPGPGNVSTSFAVGYEMGAQVLTADAILYYIGQGQDKSPALFRVDVLPNGSINPTPSELVPDVENMQILYGVDTTGGSLSTPNAYLDAAQVDATNNWANVLSVQIGLLVRSNLAAMPQPAAPQTFNILDTYVTIPADTRLRRVFTATIYVRNAPLPTS
ncbi:MAG: PilW family protein [Gammaproteobacteria bacterium]